MSEYLQTSFQFEGKPTFVSLFCFDPKGNCQITYLEVLTRYPLSDPLPDLLDVIVVVFSVVTPSSLESALGKVNKLAPPPLFYFSPHLPLSYSVATRSKSETSQYPHSIVGGTNQIPRQSQIWHAGQPFKL